jgi:hypothetical protein
MTLLNSYLIWLFWGFSSVCCKILTEINAISNKFEYDSELNSHGNKIHYGILTKKFAHNFFVCVLQMESTSSKNKQYDFIVLGATGFTGKYVAKYLRRGAAVGCAGVKWAIAGRSESKLQAVLEELKTVPNDGNDPMPDCLTTEITHQESLVHVLGKATVVLNCTGPYRFLGEHVVVACLEADSHYLDICGEPQFMEQMFLKYNKVAKDKNLMVVHACAFDSVPADMGVLFTSRQVCSVLMLCALPVSLLKILFACVFSSVLIAARQSKAF